MYKKGKFLIAEGGKLKMFVGQINGDYGYYKAGREYIPVHIPSGLALPLNSVFDDCKTPLKAKIVIQTYRDIFPAGLPTKEKYSDYYKTNIISLDCPPGIEKQLRERLVAIFDK